MMSFLNRSIPIWCRSPILHTAVVLIFLLVSGLLPGLREAPSLGFPEKKLISLRGKLLEDPRLFSPSVWDSGGRGMAGIAVSETGAEGLPGVPGPAEASAGGRVQVFFPGGSMPRVKEFGRGSELYVEGRFTPSNTGGRFSARSVHILKPAPPLERFRTALRGGLIKRLVERKGKPNKWGGLAAALLLGTRENMDGGTASRFRDAGVSHVLALSGMHLAILSGLLALLLRPLLGKKGAALGGLLFIGAYIFLVGPQPSLVRAGIMYALGVLILFRGMQRQSVPVLAAAFCLHLLADSRSAFSPSFILSYTALAGILLLSGPFRLFLERFLPGSLARPLSASLGAFTASAPAAAAFFGVLRPVGIAAGIVTVPLISLFMALSGSYLLLGFAPPLAVLLDTLLNVIQGLIYRTVELASLVPGIELPLALAALLCPLFIVLLLIVSGLYRNYRNYLAPFA
ncbi:MAG: ComEC/Rec2 family competence protein [Treponema sp.]|jgi:competence protein ComEC|nr:ComEC/Rec2 family competence protein [Treponema sp.]